MYPAGNLKAASGTVTGGRERRVVVANGFGRTAEEAGKCAHQSLQDGFERAQSYVVAEWETWQRSVTLPQGSFPARRDEELLLVRAGHHRSRHHRRVRGVRLRLLAARRGYF